MDYNSDFRYDLEWGKRGENVVAEIVEGDKTEVKSERDGWSKTRNHFVEFASRGKASGIATTQAEWWTVNFFLHDEFIFNITVPSIRLRHMCRNKKYRVVSGGDDNTSKGFLVPIVDLISVY